MGPSTLFRLEPSWQNAFKTSKSAADIKLKKSVKRVKILHEKSVVLPALDS